MKILSSLFAVLFVIGLVGCAPKEIPPVEESHKSDPNITGKVFPSHEIPEGVLTPALEAIGAPFDQEIEYRAKGLPGMADATGARTINTTVLEDGHLRLVIGWSGDLASALPHQEFEADSKGIRSIRLGGERVEPSVVALPADMKIGAKWTSQFSFTRSADQAKITMTSTSEITAMEDVVVPAGKYKAYIVKEKGTMKTSTGGNATLNGTSWYVPKIGLVKFDSTLEGVPIAGADKMKTNIIVEATKVTGRKTTESKS